MEKIRIQKYLASRGIASRRAIEKMIEKKLITVNGQHIALGTKVNGTETITVDGKRISKEEESAKKILLAFNKPKGVITSGAKEPGTKSLADFDFGETRVFPIGRLDKDSRGLLLMTNDGDLANKLTHPRYEHEKEYLVTLQSPISDSGLKKLASGTILISDSGKQKTAAEASVHRRTKNMFTITLKEGRNRQIRKMCGALGLTITDLKRIRIANIKLTDLTTGNYRPEQMSSIK
jgi:pseudouridine synthase